MISLNMSQRERNILLFGAIIVLCYSLYSFVIEPLMTRFDNLNQQIAAAELKLKKNLKILRDSKMIEEEYRKFADYMKQKASDEQEMATGQGRG